MKNEPSKKYKKKFNKKTDYVLKLIWFPVFIFGGALAYSLNPDTFFTDVFGFILLFILIIAGAIFLVGYLESQSSIHEEKPKPKRRPYKDPFEL